MGRACHKVKRTSGAGLIAGVDPATATVSHLAIGTFAYQDHESREMVAVAAVRGGPKSTLGGRGGGTAPLHGTRFVVSGRVWPRPANDNAPVHGGIEALCFATGIVLTLASWVLMLQALS